MSCKSIMPVRSILRIQYVTLPWRARKKSRRAAQDLPGLEESGSSHGNSICVTTLLSTLNALCLLSYPSGLLLWLLLACCSLRKFLFHRLQTGVAFRLFPPTCTKLCNPWTGPSFSTTAPAPIPINFPILPR